MYVCILHLSGWKQFLIVSVPSPPTHLFTLPPTFPTLSPLYPRPNPPLPFDNQSLHSFKEVSKSELDSSHSSRETIKYICLSMSLCLLFYLSISTLLFICISLFLSLFAFFLLIFLFLHAYSWIPVLLFSRSLKIGVNFAFVFIPKVSC